MNSKHLNTDTKKYSKSLWLAVACGLLLLLTACDKAPESTPQNAVTAYEWYQETDPANVIQIYQNEPGEVARRCPQAKHAGACANVGGNICVIHFARTWNEDWKLLEHELLHCAGKNHP